MMNALVSLLLGALLAQAAAAAPTPSPTPTPNVPVYSGAPAVRMTIDARPLGFDPDGNARWLLVSRFYDAAGKPTKILANSDFDWNASRGNVQWQTRMRFGQPAAIVRTRRNGPIAVHVIAHQPKLPAVTVRTDPRAWRGPRVVAGDLGPYLVQVGWFPRETQPVRIVRVDGRGRRTSAVVNGGSTYRDATVAPVHHYRYIVYRAGHRPARLPVVTTLPPPPQSAVRNASGKGMWLYFGDDPLQDHYVGNWHPQAMVRQAAAAGLHYVELRTAYGAYWEATPAVKPVVDAVVDGLAAHHIGTIGWTVPRYVTFEDLQRSVRTAYYRSAGGTRFTGLAVDLERGSDFLGSDPHGLPALSLYIRYLREALGPKYLIVATVEDAYLEHLDNAKYPFARIARYASVLQPMSYWRMMRRNPTTPAQVRVLLRASYDKLLRESRRKLPVSIGGQTTAEGRNGYPPASEIVASIAVSKATGAIGECFFDWDGTQPYQWNALANDPW